MRGDYIKVVLAELNGGKAGNHPGSWETTKAA